MAQGAPLAAYLETFMQMTMNNPATVGGHTGNHNSRLMLTSVWQNFFYLSAALWVCLCICVCVQACVFVCLRW